MSESNKTKREQIKNLFMMMDEALNNPQSHEEYFSKNKEIHDAYCDQYNEEHPLGHKVFYDVKYSRYQAGPESGEKMTEDFMHAFKAMFS